MKRWMWLAAAALAATVAVPVVSTAQADEKNEQENETPTSLDKIPPAAKDALVREAGGGQIVDVVQETEHGQTVYEAHIRKADQLLGVEVDSSGKVLKTENETNEKQHK